MCLLVGLSEVERESVEMRENYLLDERASKYIIVSGVLCYGRVIGGEISFAGIE